MTILTGNLPPGNYAPGRGPYGSPTRAPGGQPPRVAPPIWTPAAGAGGGGGLLQAAGSAVIRAPSPPLKLLAASFLLGAAVGYGLTQLWGLLNGKQAVNPYVHPPGAPLIQQPTGRVSLTGITYWKAGPGTYEQWYNKPDGSWATQTKTFWERSWYSHGPWPNTMFSKMDGWLDYGPFQGYQTLGVRFEGPAGNGWQTLVSAVVASFSIPVSATPANPADAYQDLGAGGFPADTPDPAYLPIVAPSPVEVAPAALPLPLLLPPATVPAPTSSSNPAPAVGGSAQAPQQVPRPYPAPSPVPAVRPLPAVAPGRGPVTVPDVRGAPLPLRPLNPRAVLPGTVVTPPTTAPGTTFLPNGTPLVGNGPRPDLPSMAQELGKLERKMELMLTPDDPLSPLQQLNRIIDQIENIKFLIDLLLPPEPYEFSGGEFELAAVCDRLPDGQLIDPKIAPWSGGTGELLEINRKLNALAQLIQHHKVLKQPICRGKPVGQEVTVTFEEV